MLVQFGCEDGQGAADEPDGTVGMAAGPAPVHLAEPAVQHRQVGGAAFGKPLNFPGDRVKAKQARTALARRFVGEVAGHPGGFGEPARVGWQGGDQARAHAGTERCQARGGEGRGCCRGRVYPASEEPPISSA